MEAMILQSPFIGETFIAKQTSMLLCPSGRVRPHMSDEIALVVGPIGTLGACERLFPRVHPGMDDEIGPVERSVGAQGTSKPLPAHRILVRKRFPALGALFRVTLQVPPQQHLLLGEFDAAHGASDEGVQGVGQKVLVKGHDGEKPLLAEGALELEAAIDGNGGAALRGELNESSLLVDRRDGSGRRSRRRVCDDGGGRVFNGAGHVTHRKRRFFVKGIDFAQRKWRRHAFVRRRVCFRGDLASLPTNLPKINQINTDNNNAPRVLKSPFFS